jgi:hypothetical protein
MATASIKKMTCAAALFGAWGTAQAADVNLGLITIGAPRIFTGQALGDFTDRYYFTLPANGGSGYSVVNFPFEHEGSTWNTILRSLSAFSNTDGIPLNGDQHLSTRSIPSGESGEALSLIFGPTLGGNMYLGASGVTTGTEGELEVYSGAISVSPIPEPEVWTMMLVGVGLVGFRLRHKAKRALASRLV